MLRLRTVRAKLTALVALSGLVLVAALPIIFLTLQRQLIEQADDRLETAQKSFRSEFKDGINNLKIAAHVLASDDDTVDALVNHKGEPLKKVADIFREVYEPKNPPPGALIGITIDILFADARGKIIAQTGCDQPPSQLSELDGLSKVLEGDTVERVTRHGCELPQSTPPPAYMIAAPVKAADGTVVGAVIVCLPIDQNYLDNAAIKLGGAPKGTYADGETPRPVTLHLALLPSGGNELVQKTTSFPAVKLPAPLDTPEIADVGEKEWVAIRFAPSRLTWPLAKSGLPAEVSFQVAATMDVTEIRSIVRKNLAIVLALLLAAASVSLFVGWRLASVMSRALRRVNVALKRVELLDYVHVEPTRTGDELEDLASGFNTMVDGLKERDNMKTTFGKYMTATVMDHLLSGKVQLGGETIKVTILFTDIRSFTTISEKMDPQALVGLLNEYFTEMVGIVMQEDGVVDKYIGDAIMAVFGAPVPKADDAIHAVRAAVRMRHALAHLNQRLTERGLAPLRTGIGIHTGEVIAGNIGSERRMEYTVIGDAVNLASRLESSTKDLGVNVLISEDTYQLTKHMVEARQVKEITVKGRAQPVMTYEVLGLKGEAPLPVSESAKLRHAPPVEALASAEGE